MRYRLAAVNVYSGGRVVDVPRWRLVRTADAPETTDRELRERWLVRLHVSRATRHAARHLPHPMPSAWCEPNHW